MWKTEGVIELEKEDSRNWEMENELYRCHNEIEMLEKAVIYLSKIVASKD